MSSVTLTNRQVHELVQPVLRLTSTDWNFAHVLGCVHIRAWGDGNVYAVATDRFRAGIKRVAAEVDGQVNWLIPAVDLARVLTLFRPGRRSIVKQPRLTISQEDGVITFVALPSKNADERHEFETLRVGIDVGQQHGDYPDVFKLISDALAAMREPVESQSFRAEFISSFKDAAAWTNTIGEPAPVEIRFGHGDSKPALVSVGDDFIGLVMPRKYTDDRGSAFKTGRALKTWAPALQELSNNRRKAVSA